MPTRSADPSELPGPDQRLGPYRLVRPVSAGGMARVYEGRLDSLAGVSTRVAIKVIHPEYAADGGFQDLFIAEARISSWLEHQNVVRVQQFNREGALYYLVMEFIDGVTFRRLISLSRRKRITLTPAHVAELGRQACEGLHYAHSLTGPDGEPVALVHRDVKPSNLMLTTQGVVKVLDFGISAAQGVEAPGEGEGPVVKGTWGYMAPEQAEGLPVGAAADVFGLGAVLYELATGEALFQASDPVALKQKLADDEGARRAAALSGPWRELGSLLVRALQRDPSARYPTAAAFGRALAGLAGDRLTVHEELVALAAESGPADAPTSPRAAPSVPDRPRSVSTVAAGATGLPVAVGDERGPRRTSPERPTSRRKKGSSVRASVVILVALLGALGLLGAVALFVPPATWFTPAEPVRFEAVPAGSASPSTSPAATGPAVTAPPATEPAPAVVSPSAAPAGEAAPGDAVGFAGEGELVVEPAAPRAAAGRSRTTASARPERSPEPPPAEPAPAQAAAPPSTTRSDAARTDVGSGLLTISSVPRAQVLLDGAYVDYTPYFQRKTAAGTHTVVLIAEDGRRKTFKVEVAPDAEARRVWLFDEERWGE